jgi:hypothetical protein
MRDMADLAVYVAGGVSRRVSQEFGAVRPPALSGAVLVPVWGYRFVSQFLEFGLPTLLAPGNLPTVARELPFRVIALTSAEDEPLLRSHPAWRRLQKICAADIEPIDDLITESNHSATMTLALARAMQSYGQAIVDTCFVLWMSDYLCADGSLAAVMRGFRNGASGIFAGNFQIIAEDAVPSLRRSVDLQSSAIAVSSREMLAWSFRHMHPATVANFVDSGLSHNSHTNRLFWRVDEETLIGRFYLMHPIGVRPETADFEIGSSFDYSFIPEMCPSGKILTLVDSDEYFVVEMQKRDHERDRLIAGALANAKLAAQLSEWTTAQHRANAAHTMVFHAADKPANIADTIAEADRYIASVGELLPPQPQPHRGHHYWVGSIAVSRARTGRALSREDWQFLLEESLPKGSLARLPLRLLLRLFGTLPRGTRLHPRWPDYQLLLDVLEKAIAEGQRLLLVAEEPRVFSHWLIRTTADAATVEIGRLLSASPAKYRSLFEPLAGRFTACVVLLLEAQFYRSRELLERIEPLLSPGSQISIVALNERPVAHARDFAQVFAGDSSRLFDLSARVADARYVPANRVRWRTYRALRWFADYASRSRWASPVLLGLPFCVVPLGLMSYLTSGRAKPTRSPPRLASSILVQLRLSKRGARGPWAGLAERWIGNAPVEAEPVAAAPRANYPADLVAKYSFVSGLLARRRDVAAYGCGDDFGSKMVLAKVKKLSVYDPDPVRIGEISRKIFDPWKFEAQVHNILDDPLPTVHDAIYNLDTLDYVSPSDEDRYLGNLSQSLSRHQDILIIGLTPYDADDDTAADSVHLSLRADLGLGRADRRPLGSLQIDDTGTPSSAPNGQPRYRRTSAGVKVLLESHFRTVSLFSMTGGVVQAGTSEAGDYLFALCSSKKN